MDNNKQEIESVNIKKELKNSYLDYAMSVIIGRALPDVRDGLKPVHRRVLYAMSVLNNYWNKPYKKSARIVGDVIGKYHPHGDSAVYDTIVRLVQNFSMRYALIDGQGNFGSIDGDSAAAMRYTEIRMSKISHELFEDLEKETVNFIPNYDGTEKIPDILPARIPNLLINGSSGIAVGMATNIPPHNLKEVINASLALIDNKDITIEELLEYIPGPDFPTAGIINGKCGILEAYKTGKGKINIRASINIKEDKIGHKKIIIKEIPYQVNKSSLIEKIVELVKEKKIEGILSIQDESDKDGVRVVINLKKDVMERVVLNNLYSLTQLEISYYINMVALLNNKPKILCLKEILHYFLVYRKEIVTKKTIFELKKTRRRIHTLEGLAVALVNIDSIIKLIRKTSNFNEAKLVLITSSWKLGDLSNRLINPVNSIKRIDLLGSDYGIKNNAYYLTDDQAQSILKLRLQKLTNLEYDKVLNEYDYLLKKISELLSILNSSNCLVNIVKKELIEIKNQYSDPRRTKIINNVEDINIEDLITKENIIIVLSYFGYIKYHPLSTQDVQNRGGSGKSLIRLKNGDFIKSVLLSNTHDTILFFSNYGRLYWMKAFRLSSCNSGKNGKPIVNFLSLKEKEVITNIFSLSDLNISAYLFMATANGIVKRISLKYLNRPRISGIFSINLKKNDELVDVVLTYGKSEIMLFSSYGKVVRFSEKFVRPMARGASGVLGIRLENNDKLVSLIVVREKGDILTITENGYGKRTIKEKHPIKSRATKGVLAIKVNERNGNLVGAVQVKENDQVMIFTNSGNCLRMFVKNIRIVGRSSQGVILMKTSKNKKIIGLKCCLNTNNLF